MLLSQAMRPRRIHSSRNGHTHISLHVLAEILEPNCFFHIFSGAAAAPAHTPSHSCNVMCIHTRLMSPDFKEFGALWKKVFGSSIAPSLAAGDVTLGRLGERIAISDLYVSVGSVHNCILFDKWSECDFKRTAEKHRPLNWNISQAGAHRLCRCLVAALCYPTHQDHKKMSAAFD